MSQHALSVVTYIQPAERDALEQLLEVIGNDISGTNGNSYIRFAELETIHFACWVVLRSTPDSANPANIYPDTLVLETNYDGDLETHLDELIAKGAAALNAIYSKCNDWPASGSPAQIKQYLKAHSIPNAAFYIGCPGHTVADIRNAMAVREELERFLNSEERQQPLAGQNPTQIRAKLLQYLSQSEQAKPHTSPETLDAQSRRAQLNTALLVLIGLPILLLSLPFLLVWYIALRIHEAQDAHIQKPPLPVDPRLFGKEDIFVQNHLTTLVDVKPGAFRLNTLKLVLWLINLLTQTVFITGQLGGIPTIHFARWLLLENDRRLLFFSNYDGSWASYLGDFVDKANYGLTAVWSNTDRFPPATNLAFGGAQHIEAFKQWSRQHNVYAAVWYSAYPNETLRNLNNDIQIRDTIVQPNLSEAETLQLLQRF